LRGSTNSSSESYYLNLFIYTSYAWAKETFKEFTPIKDYSGKKFDLEFVKIEIGEPKYDEHYAKAQKMTLDIPVRAIVRSKTKRKRPRRSRRSSWPTSRS
jgi:hypothetical protein